LLMQIHHFDVLHHAKGTKPAKVTDCLFSSPIPRHEEGHLRWCMSFASSMLNSLSWDQHTPFPHPPVGVGLWNSLISPQLPVEIAVPVPAQKRLFLFRG